MTCDLCMHDCAGEFSFVYKAHMLKPLAIRNNALHRYELESLSSDSIVAVKALKGNCKQYQLLTLCVTYNKS